MKKKKLSKPNKNQNGVMLFNENGASSSCCPTNGGSKGCCPNG